MTPRPPDWDRLLLAYADGELGPEACAAVERRLEADPAAAELLVDLVETGPSNSDLWECVPIPEPSEDDWKQTSQAIAALALRRRGRWPAAVEAGLACAVAVAVAALAWPTPEPVAPMAQVEPTPQSPNPLANLPVRPVATPDEASPAERPPEALALADPDLDLDDTDVTWDDNGEMTFRPKK